MRKFKFLTYLIGISKVSLFLASCSGVSFSNQMKPNKKPEGDIFSRQEKIFKIVKPPLSNSRVQQNYSYRNGNPDLRESRIYELNESNFRRGETGLTESNVTQWSGKGIFLKKSSYPEEKKTSPVKIALLGNPGVGKTTFHTAFCECDENFTRNGFRDKYRTTKIISAKVKEKYNLPDFTIVDLPGFYEKNSEIPERGLDTSYVIKKHLEEEKYNAVLFFISFDTNRDLSKRVLECFEKTAAPFIKSNYDNIIILISKFNTCPGSDQSEVISEISDAFKKKYEINPLSLPYKQSTDSIDESEFEWLNGTIHDLYNKCKKMRPISLNIDYKNFYAYFNTNWYDKTYDVIYRRSLEEVDVYYKSCCELLEKNRGLTEEAFNEVYTSLSTSLKKFILKKEDIILEKYKENLSEHNLFRLYIGLRSKILQRMYEFKDKVNQTVGYIPGAAHIRSIVKKCPKCGIICSKTDYDGCPNVTCGTAGGNSSKDSGGGVFRRYIPREEKDGNDMLRVIKIEVVNVDKGVSACRPSIPQVSSLSESSNKNKKLGCGHSFNWKSDAIELSNKEVQEYCEQYSVAIFEILSKNSFSANDLKNTKNEILNLIYTIQIETHTENLFEYFENSVDRSIYCGRTGKILKKRP